MDAYVYWFLLCLVLLGIEMVSGTFYLLVVAIAAAVAGMSALLGMAMVGQMILSALTGISGILILRNSIRNQVTDAANFSIDIGQPVRIIKWNGDRSARVNYRGTEWDAQLESPETPSDVTLYIASMQGSSLVLTHRKTPQS
jgi:membrane protein implicated in regulation of membrane protease activity